MAGSHINKKKNIAAPQRAPRLPLALRTALAYALAGALLILILDRSLDIVLAYRTGAQLALLEIVKALAFIAVTAAVLYVALARAERRVLLGRLERDELSKHFGRSMQYARDIVLLHDEAGRLLECNDAAVAAYGYRREELLGLNIIALRAPETLVKFASDFASATTFEGGTFESVHRRKDGSTFPVETSARLIEIDGQRFTQSVIRDISARKATERRIEHLKRLYATLSHTNKAIVFARGEEELFAEVCRVAVEHGAMMGAVVRMADEEAKILRAVACSESMRAMANQIVARIGSERSETRPPTETAFAEGRVVVHNDVLGDPADFDWLRVARAAGVRSVAALPLLRGGKPVGVFTLNTGEADFFDPDTRALLEEMAADISFGLDNFERERRRGRAEQALAESEERFRGLVEQSVAGIAVIELEGNCFIYVNPRFAEIFGYAPEEMVGLPVLDTVADEDKPLVRENIRKRASGEVKSVAYSITSRRKDGSTVRVGVHGARATIEGRPIIISMLQDISERERAQRQIEAYVKQLEEAMLGTVNAVSTMVELRDPYTSGHERRVGALARALAAELGLPEETCKGIEITGAVHDIGKISVPAEILSKPSRLTEVEFALIKTHAQLGYDILNKVSFPWPVARTVLQHHERLDGSGYPNGLKGEDIALEARILAVADVVESMGSHRPYRPTLGIDAALAEIEKFRGVRYDAQVADACLRLFREKSYQLPG